MRDLQTYRESAASTLIAPSTGVGEKENAPKQQQVVKVKGLMPAMKKSSSQMFNTKLGGQFGTARITLDSINLEKDRALLKLAR